MSREKHKEISSSSEKRSASAPTARRIIQNFLLIWLDENLDESTDNFQHSVSQLQRVVININTYTDVVDCVDFLADIKDEKALMIVSGAFAQHTILRIHDIPQLNSIFVFGDNKTRQEEWPKNCWKVKGVFTEIDSVCEALKRAAHQCDRDATSISFVSSEEQSDKNLDELDHSFMYTQILKEILFELEYNEQSLKDLVAYFNRLYVRNYRELEDITNFERDYRLKSPIWWYTSQCFLYHTLNRALRTLEVDTIIHMGFFICDLHRQIERLHSEQFKDKRLPLTVYRGQGLSRQNFEKLMNTKGGLISFNNFLSTSQDRLVSFTFALSSADDPDLIGILFKMTVDPLVSKFPFALINEVSQYETEQEMLISMHTVFRIGEMKKLDDNERLWQVELTLTTDNDPLLYALTEQMRMETTEGSVKWDRLGKLLLKLGQFDKAEEVYRILLDQETYDDVGKAYYYHQLGYTKRQQENYVMAIEFYEKALDIKEKTFPENHLTLAASYNNLAAVYDEMGEYSNALSFYQKALDINQKTLPENHPLLATSYNNIGLVYESISEYSEALSVYEKAFEIYQKTLPANHSSLAASYNNIGAVYQNIGEYTKALSFFEKALVIRQKTLPENHPDLATSYNNVGLVYNDIGEYSKALSFCEKDLEINQKILPANRPSLATSYNNIGLVYNSMGEYSKALSSHEKAVEIRQTALPANHPDLAQSYKNIGTVYDNMGEYVKALSSHEKALEIEEKTLSANHPSLATSYNNIASVYYHMNEYSKALPFFERSNAILERSVPSDHPHLQASRAWLELIKKRCE